ncbi:DUF806 family protein [Leuconostoc carnosum]|uniref:DUF806 family protein n=2 Tax=Leuconostoc carnosum TaxID=1252 RepID=UPI000D5123E3|nr:DUF806 family protein [Leuconostoc carnosum]WLC97588.1 DUF806 family protein [Leuconostoc carnosum]WLC98177.1 DUF806 family protein [Leuconostoc carnosum]SPJ44101.1 hypothetical protein LCAC16_80185 [Leuconostoc carnosum]
MTALMDAYKVIKANSTFADTMYAKKLDQTKIKPNQTFILVRDSTQELSSFGSDTFVGMNYAFQVQIFYSTNPVTFDYDEVEIKLMKVLESNGYRIQTVRGRMQDPDSFQDFQTIIISKEKETI